MKKYLLLIVFAVLAVIMIAHSAFAAEPVTVTTDGPVLYDVFCEGEATKTFHFVADTYTLYQDKGIIVFRTKFEGDYFWGKFNVGDVSCKLLVKVASK